MRSATGRASDAMWHSARLLGSAAAAALVALLVSAPIPAHAHSGGLDSAGCHAGSQPYHCHGGGGGSSGGDSSSDDSSYDPGPTAAEIAAAAAAAEERRAIAAAQVELNTAKANHTKVTNELAALEEKRDTAHAELLRRSEPYEKLKAKVDFYEERADSIREGRIEKREAAALRLASLQQQNRQARTEYNDQRIAAPFAAAFFGGFLLLSLVRRLAELIVPWRWLWLLAGLTSSMLLFSVGSRFPSSVGGVLSLVFGGLLLSLVVMLPGLWWLRFSIPRPLTLVGLAFCGLMLVASAAVFVTLSAPAAVQPAAGTLTLLAEATADPAAQEVEGAVEAEETAESLQAKLDKLEPPLKEARIQDAELTRLLNAAKEQAAIAEQAVATAQANLDNVQ